MTIEQLTQEVKELKQAVHLLHELVEGRAENSKKQADATLGFIAALRGSDIATTSVLTAAVVSHIMSSPGNQKMFKLALEQQVNLARPNLQSAEVSNFDVEISNIRQWVSSLD